MAVLYRQQYRSVPHHTPALRQMVLSIYQHVRGDQGYYMDSTVLSSPCIFLSSGTQPASYLPSFCGQQLSLIHCKLIQLTHVGGSFHWLWEIISACVLHQSGTKSSISWMLSCPAESLHKPVWLNSICFSCSQKNTYLKTQFCMSHTLCSSSYSFYPPHTMNQQHHHHKGMHQHESWAVDAGVSEKRNKTLERHNQVF